MRQTLILLPMVALAIWTFLVLLLVPYQRFRAAFNRQVTAEDFKFGESANVPSHVSIPNRNFMNLLEVPVLFYVASLTMYVTHTVDTSALALAWAYVALRVMHSLVHLSYNRVIHRLVFFAVSNLVAVALWVKIGLALTTA